MTKCAITLLFGFILCVKWTSLAINFPVLRVSIGRPTFNSTTTLSGFGRSQLNVNNAGHFSKWPYESVSAPPGHVMLQKNVTIGYGSDAFARATDQVLNFSLTNSLNWVRMINSQRGAAAGSDIATVTRFYGLPIWSINPCRVVDVVRHGVFGTTNTRGTSEQGLSKQRVGRFSQVSFATLQGHLLEGEEALRVYTIRRGASTVVCSGNITGKHTVLGDTDEVIFEIASYSKGSNWLGRALLPLIRPLQRKFMVDHCNAALDIVGTGHL